MIKRIAILWLVSAPAFAAEYSALLDWSQRAVLSVSVTGVVETVGVQPGQTVRKNDVLASLNAKAFEAGVMEAKADIERLTREEEDARRELERAQELYARTVSSTTELDAAKLRHARSSALLAASQARVERARRQLEESAVRAPFDAVILERQAEPGMVTSQCQPLPLLTVARADEILARAEVPAQQVSGIALGSPATVQVAGRNYLGLVRSIRTNLDGKYLVEATFSRPADLMAGLPAKVRLP